MNLFSDPRLRQARQRASRLLSFSFLLLLCAMPALAQESEPSPADSSAGWAFRWLNFAIVFAGILWFALKICGPYFRGRTAEIANKVAEGTRAREAAEQQRREVQTKMAGIDQEVARIREEAMRSGEAEAVRLREASRKEAEAVEHAAEEEIAAAQRSARFELKTLAARLAIERAEALLRLELTPEAESKLLQAFVRQLASTSATGSLN